MNRRQHWNAVYATRGERDLSWFETVPAASLQLMESAGLAPETSVIDIGGGESRLVDHLVARGVTSLAVLDVSGVALQRAQDRIGRTATPITWIESDVAGDWSLNPVDIWHDRAVFHFLTTAEDRAGYLAQMRRIVKPAGTVIMATFALEGPEKCSGLPVARYSSETLARELGLGFELLEAVPYLHRTPWGATQSFQYSRLRRVS